MTIPADDGSDIPEGDQAGPQSNMNDRKSRRPKSAESRGVSSMEDNFYANLVLTPEGKLPKKNKDSSDSISTNIKSKGIFEMDDSPYIQHLSPRSKKLIRRGEYHPQKDGIEYSRTGSFNSTPIYGKHYSEGLLTTSESGVDSRKKKKKFTSMGKKFLVDVKKSITGKSQSRTSVAPYPGDDSSNQGKGIKPDWIDPNTKDYSKKSTKNL